MALGRLVSPALAALLTISLGGCRTAAPKHNHTPQSGADALRKCTILLPRAYGDGTPVPAAVLADIQDRLYTRFDGFTVAGTVAGAYRMADGTRANDESLEIWVAVPAQRIGELRREVARFCHVLRQESLYLDVSAATVEFVGPADP